MNPIERLSEYFRDLPGIGPRQARRFVDYILSRDQGYANEMSHLIVELRKGVIECNECRRHFPADASNTSICTICRDQSRDAAQLLIVEKDVDLESVERSGEYRGRYFVAGAANLRRNEVPQGLPDLLGKIAHEKNLREIILALSATPAGEFAADAIARELAGVAASRDIALTVLGRGLSTGTELEYSDKETLKNALQNRKKK